MSTCVASPRTDGSADRIGSFFDAISGPLMRYLLRLTRGEHHLAEDLLQETFLRAWRNVDTMPADAAAARPWLFTVARRATIDALRARRARVTEVELSPLDTGEEQRDIADRVVDSELIRAALPKLTPRHQEILIEVYFRDREVEDIARHLQVPEGTVKSRTFYALRSLGAALADAGKH